MMKTNKLYWGTLAVVLGMSACTNEADEFATAPEGAVRFNSTINVGTKVNANGDAWTGGEKVGVFMVGETEFAAVAGAANISYTTAANGDLAPTDGTHLVYPENGDKVRFAAYYPFTATVAGNVYKIDLAAEGEHDFMYVPATAAYDKTNQNAVSLQFAHQLSKLTLNVVSEEGAEATGVTAKITRNTTADFDLATGQLGAAANSKELVMTADGATLSTLVMPGTDANSRIVFVHQGKSYTWNIAASDFKAGTHYEYTINLKGQAVPEVEATLNSSIKGWDSVSNSQDVNQDATADVVYTGAAFAGTLTQGAAIEGAKITVSYTNGDASEQTVTTVVEGAAAAGISVAEKQVTLANGEGSFDLEVTGTPTAAGDVTFSVKIGENVIATAKATVAAGEQGETPVYTSNITLPEGTTTDANKASGGKVIINDAEYNILKLGTGSVIGSWVSPAIGQGKATIAFYAVAWKGKAAKLKLTIENGGTFADGAASKEFTLKENAGATGNPPFTITPATEDFFTAELKETTDATTIKFESIKDTDCRALLWGINVN